MTSLRLLTSNGLSQLRGWLNVTLQNEPRAPLARSPLALSTRIMLCILAQQILS